MDAGIAQELMREVEFLRRRVSELVSQLEDADNTAESLRDYASNLREQLKKYTNDVPEMPCETVCTRVAKAMRCEVQWGSMRWLWVRLWP